MSAFPFRHICPGLAIAALATLAGCGRPPTLSITAVLNAIEARAQRAIVQELRLMKKEVLQLRPSLSPEDQDHADALLLKLGRLESDQVILPPDAGVLEQGFQAVAQAA